MDRCADSARPSERRPDLAHFHPSATDGPCFFEHGPEVAEGIASRVELFESIRRDHDREDLSIRVLARRHGMHRRTVRWALESASPPERKRPVRRPAPALGPYCELIDSWLVADESAPIKQRHTAKRVWERLSDEYGAQVAQTGCATMCADVVASWG